MGGAGQGSACVAGGIPAEGLVAPYLCLLPESAEARHHPLRGVFNGLRYLVRYGVAWRAMSNDLPPWHAVYEQAQRWLRAGCFEVLAQDVNAGDKMHRRAGVKLHHR